jgi:hypothetical protein
LQHLDTLTPGRPLRIVDLTQIEHLSLDNPVIRRASVFDNAPIAVFFAIFETALGS